ncbi:MAG: MBL fold metallo-hydrolase [Desulfobacteraceae bacterium]|nr:MBL fold metallo-hydrolase [Desulfobacteraceae bacterium]
MKIRFLGHSCFLIVSDTGIRIITDPYHTGEEFTLTEIKESADIVTVSHEHPDHNNTGAVQGNPLVLTKQANVNGMEFTAVQSYHDEAGGKERGGNLIFTFEVDGIKICHLGDLGHQLDDSQLATIGKVDILIVPVGGGFTIDGAGATEVCNQINPKVIIPMHYKTAGLPFLADIGDFLKGKNNVTNSSGSMVEFTCDKLPERPQIIVLKPELLTN